MCGFWFARLRKGPRETPARFAVNLKWCHLPPAKLRLVTAPQDPNDHPATLAVYYPEQSSVQDCQTSVDQERRCHHLRFFGQALPESSAWLSAESSPGRMLPPPVAWTSWRPWPACSLPHPSPP